VKVRWTARAGRHLHEIQEHISQDSPLDAQRLIARIVARGEQIEQFPLSGRIVPEYRTDTVREVFEEPYRIIYRLTRRFIDVVAVIHGARRLR
jgi:toxin ParE1/3/4